MDVRLSDLRGWIAVLMGSNKAKGTAMPVRGKDMHIALAAGPAEIGVVRALPLPWMNAPTVKSREKDEQNC